MAQSSYQWLDEILTLPGVPLLFRDFGPFGRTNTLIDTYDAWCRGIQSGVPGVYDTLPSTYSGSNITAVRFSVETPGRGTWGQFLTDTNLQTSMVIVETPP